MLTITPLPIPHGIGSPVNPICYVLITIEISPTWAFGRGLHPRCYFIGPKHGMTCERTTRAPATPASKVFA
jgi:hypothetical protein